MAKEHLIHALALNPLNGRLRRLAWESSGTRVATVLGLRARFLEGGGGPFAKVITRVDEGHGEGRKATVGGGGPAANKMTSFLAAPMGFSSDHGDGPS